MKIPKKDEYESTAQYKEKLRSLVGQSTPAEFIISRTFNRNYIEYDADKKELYISSSALGGHTYEYSYAFLDYRINKVIDSGSITHGNIAVITFISDVVSGSYEASNAYGGRTMISRVDRTVKAVFERKSDRPGQNLFPAADKAPYRVGFLKVSPETAKQLKGSMQFAYVVQPKEPYIAAGKHKPYDHMPITINNPVDVTENYTILISDIKCGLALDGDGVVIGAYPTR